MTKSEEIGLRLKEFVEKKFNSTAELARLLGVTRSYFNPYFSGKSVLGGETLSKLAELGCDINWLLGGATSSVGNNIHEPTESYNMSYSELLSENKTLKEEIKEFKISIFDLERETKKLHSKVIELEETNLSLQKELENCLDKGAQNKLTN